MNSFLKDKEDFYKNIYEKYIVRMTNYAYYILDDWYDAEDAVSESFTNIINHLDVLSGLEEKQEKKYIKNCVRNKCIDIIKKRNKIILYDDPEEELKIISDSNEETAIDSDMMFEQIACYAEKINPEYKMLIEKKYILGYDTKEIAEQMGISGNNVRAKLSRIHKYIREAINRGELHEDDD